jgi:hypothetical protein
MNGFLEKTHKQIMGSVSELSPDTGTLTVDIAVDNSIGIVLYRFRPGYRAGKKPVVILTIASDAQMSDGIAGIVYPLIDNVGVKDDRLVIIHSDGKSKGENDIQTFLSEKADMFHPDYLRLPVSSRNLQSSVNGQKYTGLKNILGKYYTDEIFFIGPVTGKQFVNMEIYRDICCECKQEINIVSGIVFPKAQMPQWDNPYWKYYNTLIPVYLLPNEYSKQIKRIVHTLREKNTNITPPVFYQDIETGENDWTVMCPHCRNVINKYEPEDHRMRYSFDLDNRKNGNLQYHTILIDANQALINLLDASLEAAPCVCYGGWVELKNMQS